MSGSRPAEGRPGGPPDVAGSPDDPGSPGSQGSAPLPDDYAAAVAAVQARGRFGIRLGLARTRALLRALGSPEAGVRGALVGGTNGKGSVVALVSACLAAAGHRAGDTPKPHLVTYRERLRIAGRPIDADAFTALVRDVLPAADRVARRHGPPTEFELMTALAFAWFAREAVDLAVVEVGLGGRLDATHAWDGGVAAITNVDLDHTEWLGPTVRDIAREKAAIIVRGDRAVTGATGEALAVIRARARRVGVDLVEVAPAPVLAMRPGGHHRRPRRASGTSGSGSWGVTRRRTSPSPTRSSTRSARRGSRTCPRPHGAPATRRRAGRGGSSCWRWPASDPGGTAAEVLLDGAHNPAGAAALAAALDELRPQLRAGRPAAGPAHPRSRGHGRQGRRRRPRTARGRALLAGARVIATQVEGPRALPADALAARWAALAGAGDRPGRGSPGAGGVPWTSRSRRPRARSSSPDRSTSSERRGRFSSTTRSSATRRPDGGAGRTIRP